MTKSVEFGNGAAEAQYTWIGFAARNAHVCSCFKSVVASILTMISLSAGVTFLAGAAMWRRWTGGLFHSWNDRVWPS